MVDINGSSHTSGSSCCSLTDLGEWERKVDPSLGYRGYLPMESGHPGILVTLWWAEIEEETPGNPPVRFLCFDRDLQMSLNIFKCANHYARLLQRDEMGLRITRGLLYYILCFLLYLGLPCLPHHFTHFLIM